MRTSSGMGHLAIAALPHEGQGDVPAGWNVV
jgi:hypothetical protein